MPDADAVLRKGMHQDFPECRARPCVPHAVFGGCCLPRGRSDPRYLAQGEGPGDAAVRIPDASATVVRHAIDEIALPALVEPFRCRHGTDPSLPPPAEVSLLSRDAATPASTASSPANVTIALAPLIGAGRRG